MIVISAREFRDHQKSYLDKLDEGMELLIQRGKNKSYKIISMKKDDDSLLSKEAFDAKIERSLQQYKEGQYTTITGKEELTDFLNSL